LATTIDGNNLFSGRHVDTLQLPQIQCERAAA
jgi:hypothetical protein